MAAAFWVAHTCAELSGGAWAAKGTASIVGVMLSALAWSRPEECQMKRGAEST